MARCDTTAPKKGLAITLMYATMQLDLEWDYPFGEGLLGLPGGPFVFCRIHFKTVIIHDAVGGGPEFVT